MSNAAKPSETEAIRQVIAEGGMMDYIDVVAAVQKRFGMTVSSGLVERVHMQMRQEAQENTSPRIKLELGVAEATEAAEKQASQATPSDHLAQALHFVKSVHGLQNAKRALAELEAMLRDIKD